MFNAYIPLQPHKNIYNIYNTIQSEFKKINTLNCFVNYITIPPDELLMISKITLSCVDQLGELSTIYIKKINDTNLSCTTINQLNKLLEVHNDLLEKLYKFNEISIDISNNLKNIEVYGFSNNTQSYMNWDIINRYKLIISQIIDLTNKLNVYLDLIKTNIF